MYSENCKTSKIELLLGNSQRMSSASRSRKKPRLRYLTEPQVRKIGDITDFSRWLLHEDLRLE